MSRSICSICCQGDTLDHGGTVAVVHLKGKVLGVVHSAMPTHGAAAAYKRIRCGFEGGALPTYCQCIVR